MTTSAADINLTSLVPEDESSNEENSEDKQKLTYLTWIGCIVTILACLATSMAFIGYRLLRSGRVVIRISFLSILGLGEASFVSGLTLYKDVPGVCAITALFTHYSCLSSFAWLLCYILFLGNEIKGEENYYALSAIHYTSIGWGVPFLVVLISLIWRYEDFMDSEYCWLNSEDLMELAFVIPAIFLIVVSYILLAYVIYIYRNAIKNPKFKLTLKVTWSGIRSCFVLLPMLGGTWLLGTYTVMKRSIFLQIAFSVCNAALGIFIFLFMFILNEEMIQKRRESRGFFPATAKEKREKEEAKVTKQRRTFSNVVKTHPMSQIVPKSKRIEEEKISLKEMPQEEGRGFTSRVTSVTNETELTQIVAIDESDGSRQSMSTVGREDSQAALCAEA